MADPKRNNVYNMRIGDELYKALDDIEQGKAKEIKEKVLRLLHTETVIAITEKMSLACHAQMLPILKICAEMTQPELEKLYLLLRKKQLEVRPECGMQFKAYGKKRYKC